MSEYTSKAIVNTIKATSRASVKVKESFYTVEYSEERLIPAEVNVDIDKERVLLWDKVNGEVDDQITDIINLFNKKK